MGTLGVWVSESEFVSGTKRKYATLSITVLLLLLWQSLSDTEACDLGVQELRLNLACQDVRPICLCKLAEARPFKGYRHMHQ